MHNVSKQSTKLKEIDPHNLILNILECKLLAANNIVIMHHE